MNLDDVPVPDTSAARAAREVATAYCSPALANHCLRSYIWAASYGMERGIAFDAELLYVSAMLHDIGLAKEFDSHTVAFEEAGGHVAWVFGAGAGWPVERRTRAAEIIVRHMWDSVDPDADPEGHLLEIATGLDISGRNPDKWPADFRAEVVRQIPRLTLGEEFVACFESQARRKPTSAAAAAIDSGIADRIAKNVLDSA
ncbi:HD domain-containing protein [Planosporangium thailandense]|uniref:HD domain-containing protein n=1 Tax=Planosporangium thailandense TaxID=765197 RepID=A0ABX0XU50_9ACTN|nr:HD domain-containing protein [Planosporangium thailandense]